MRNLYTGREKTFNRKLKEACLAIKLSDKWSKPKILDEYLNTVYYGNHAYGVEAAAQTYFSKHASQLTLLQSAMLAGLPQAPSDYDPLHNPRAALARRDEVLRALLVNQQITQHQYDVAIRVAVAEPEAGPHLLEHQAAVLLLVRDRPARAPVRRDDRARGWAQGLHDDRSASAAPRAEGDPRRPAVQDRPGGGGRLGRAGHRRDPRHDAVVRTKGQPVQSRRAVDAPGRLDVQDARPRVGDRARRRPGLDVLHLGAVHVLDGRVVHRGEAVGRAHVRQHVQRLASR